MAYIAIRPVRFDKDYFIGETIPDEVIAESRAEALIKMGRITKVAAEANTGTDENKEDKNRANSAHTEDSRENTIYVKSKLTLMNQESLFGIAKEMNIEVAENASKKELISAIMKAQDNQEG